MVISLEARWGYEAIAENSLKNKLRDVDSAKFKDLKMHGNILCGHVNAKNGFGGYTGYKMFIGNGIVGFMETDLSPGEWLKVWTKSCK